MSQKEYADNMRLRNGIIGILTDHFWYALDNTIILQCISDGCFFFRGTAWCLSGIIRFWQIVVLPNFQSAFSLNLRNVKAGNFQTGMLQHIRLDLRIGCSILELGHIHIFQRELNPNLFRVDLALGKQDNRLHVASNRKCFYIYISYLNVSMNVCLP